MKIQNPSAFNCCICNKKLGISVHVYNKHDEVFCDECAESEIAHINNLIRNIPNGKSWTVGLTVFSKKGQETEYHVRYASEGCLERMHIEKNQINEIIHIACRYTTENGEISALETKARVILTEEQHAILMLAEEQNGNPQE